MDQELAQEPAPVDEAVVEDTSYDEADCKKIAEFEKLVEIPSWCQDTFRYMDSDARYVREECQYANKNDEDAVSTNYILRNQYVLISQIYARNPTARVQPAPMMGPQPPGLQEFAKTLEIVAKRLTDEADFRRKLGGAIQDVQTHGIAWLKVTTQSDITKDPLGQARHDDQLDNIARLQVLINEFQNGEFNEDSQEYSDLRDLSDTVRVYLAGNLREDLARNPPQPVSQFDQFGQEELVPDPMDPRIAQMAQLEDPNTQMEPQMLPEVPVFLGINIDEVLPHDIRFDWSITRPEDIYNAAWMAHRVYMSLDDIAVRWHVDQTELAACVERSKASAGKRRTAETENQANRENQMSSDRVMNDMMAVWEMWDKATCRRYVWIEGMDKFVVNEVARNTWHRFFPFFPLVFNRVTGRFLPVSDVQLQRPLQDEINRKRTHFNESQAAAYPRFVVAAGAISEDEKARLEQALPYSVTELQHPDTVDIKELVPMKIDPMLYDKSDAVREIEISAGIPQQAAGGVGGAEFATEVAVANQQMGVQADRRRTVIEELIRDINECVIEMALQLFPEENIIALAGQGAVWPLIDRDHLWRQLHVVIQPGMSGKPDADKVLAKWVGFSDMMNRLGLVVNGLEVGRKIVDELDLGIDFDRYVMMPAPMPVGPGGPGGPAGAGSGPGAGAPPMSERSGGPPTPETVNNAPSGKPA